MLLLRSELVQAWAARVLGLRCRAMEVSREGVSGLSAASTLTQIQLLLQEPASSHEAAVGVGPSGLSTPHQPRPPGPAARGSPLRAGLAGPVSRAPSLPHTPASSSQHHQLREGCTLLIGLFPFNKDQKSFQRQNDRLVNFISQLQKDTFSSLNALVSGYWHITLTNLRSNYQICSLLLALI